MSIFTPGALYIPPDINVHQAVGLLYTATILIDVNVDIRYSQYKLGSLKILSQLIVIVCIFITASKQTESLYFQCCSRPLKNGQRRTGYK